MDPIDAFSDDLSAVQRAELERLLRDDPAFRAEVEALRPVVRALHALPAEAWDPPAVGPAPPLPSEEPPPAPAPRAASRRGRRAWTLVPRLSPLATGLALVALLAGVVIGSRHDTTTPPVPVGRVTLLPLASGSTAHGTATMLADHELEIDATGLAPSPANTVYTVWLLNRNLTMEPVGSFQVGTDGRTHILMPMPFNAQRYDFLDISVEPDNGVPTHSGKSVLRATIT